MTATLTPVTSPAFLDSLEASCSALRGLGFNATVQEHGPDHAWLRVYEEKRCLVDETIVLSDKAAAMLQHFAEAAAFMAVINANFARMFALGWTAHCNSNEVVIERREAEPLHFAPTHQNAEEFTKLLAAAERQ